MKKSERETWQLGQLLEGAESSSWVRHFDWLTPVMSARVKVTVNLSLSYGFNQNSDEGLGTVHNPCPSLSCLKSIFLDPGRRDIYTLLHCPFSSHLNHEPLSDGHQDNVM